MYQSTPGCTPEIRGGWARLTQWRAEKKPEGIHLDYKVANWTGKDISDDDRKNLAKSMSGFGNVDGGVLVFGAATTTPASTKVEVLNALKGVSPLDQYEERVRVYVKTSTEPPVPGVIVQKIEGSEQPNHGIVIVYIPLTDMGPFRARGPKADVEGKYFYADDERHARHAAPDPRRIVRPPTSPAAARRYQANRRHLLDQRLRRERWSGRGCRHVRPAEGAPWSKP